MEDVTSHQKGEKYSVHKLYSNPQKELKLLRAYILESSLPVVHKQRLIEFFDFIFAKEGIHELRNKRIHHFAENQLRLGEDKTIVVTFSTWVIKKHSLSEIHHIKNNLQLVVSLAFMVVTSAMFSIVAQILEKELQMVDE